MSGAEPRVWGGTTLDARREARRERLLAVGLELLGGPDGPPAVSVRSVCRHARLTDRYFYESFADREALLVAVYEQVGREALRVLAEAVRTTTADPSGPEVPRAAVRAFMGLLTEDPRKGRVLLLAPLSDPTLNRCGLLLQPAFVELLRGQLAVAVRRPEPDELAQRLTASALIGALTNLFARWLDGSLAASAEQLTEYCVRLLVHSVPLAGG
jgi:AcrR family transcriptional regulator